ncbi:MAG: hypothetical protein JNK15_00565 [Planctomycetes bacterium]|nr:hypothetical protein [Planctomycetota bacterium]
MSSVARSTVPFLFLIASGCMSMRYDLSGLPFPVSASPAPGTTQGERFERKSSHVQYGFGLFGEAQPDVRGILAEEGAGCTAIADLRVTSGASLHAWLATHLSLGLVRYKVVTVTGVKLREAR